MRARASRYFLFCLVAIAASDAWAAPVGLVERASGDTWIYSRTQPAKHLNAGEAIESGVTITTGNKSSVVLRFNDGQLVVLASNATFRVKNFVYDPQQPDQGQLYFDLVKGGLHAVTGNIGEKNPKGWLLETPFAIVGIGGTDFNAVVGQSLYAHVNAGAVTLANGAGAATIPAGANGMVAGEGALPTTAVTVPNGLFAELQALSAGGAGAPAAGGGIAAASAGVSAGTVGAAVLVVGVAAAAIASGSSDSTSTATHH